jgi:hypothetical protein
MTGRLIFGHTCERTLPLATIPKVPNDKWRFVIFRPAASSEHK